jgi:lysophosphatidic acid acyltransferase / lysophosphatidylinositol acyltransferase
VGNHSIEIDYLITFALADWLKVEGSNNAFSKKSVKYLPIIGQCFSYCARYIFLDRSFEKDEKIIKSQLREYIKLKTPGSTLLYPEGYVITNERYEASVKFAKSRNLPILKHHLTPRTKGFKTCIEVMKEFNENCAIFNLHVMCKGLKPTLRNLVLGKAFEIHVYMESIPIDKVEATDEWLFNFFKLKDELSESFVKFGNFYEGRNLQPVEGIEIKPRLRVVINFVCWVIVTIVICAMLSIWIVENNLIFILIIIILICKLSILSIIF